MRKFIPAVFFIQGCSWKTCRKRRILPRKKWKTNQILTCSRFCQWTGFFGSYSQKTFGVYFRCCIFECFITLWCLFEINHSMSCCRESDNGISMLLIGNSLSLLKTQRHLNIKCTDFFLCQSMFIRHFHWCHQELHCSLTSQLFPGWQQNW